MNIKKTIGLLLLMSLIGLTFKPVNAVSSGSKIMVCEFGCEAKFEFDLGVCFLNKRLCQATNVANRGVAAAGCQALGFPSSVACNAAATAAFVAAQEACDRNQRQCTDAAAAVFGPCLSRCQLTGGTGL